MAQLKTKRTFVGSRAVRTLGALTLGAGMTLGGLSLAWAGDEVPGPDEVRALGYNTLTFQDEFDGSELDTSKWVWHLVASIPTLTLKPNTLIPRKMSAFQVVFFA